MPCLPYSCSIGAWRAKYRPTNQGKGRGVTKPRVKKRKKR